MHGLCYAAIFSSKISGNRRRCTLSLCLQVCNGKCWLGHNYHIIHVKVMPDVSELEFFLCQHLISFLMSLWVFRDHLLSCDEAFPTSAKGFLLLLMYYINISFYYLILFLQIFWKLFNFFTTIFTNLSEVKSKSNIFFKLLSCSL